MADLTFGLDQMGKETPKSIKLIYRLTMFFSAMWAFFTMSKFCTISDHANAQVLALLGLINFGIYNFCQCFGFKCPEQIRQFQSNGLPVYNNPPNPTKDIETKN